MQDQAYEAMQTMQDRHWWWRGMRRLYQTALYRFGSPGPACRVIDVGCGFGANLEVLGQTGAVVGVDVSLEALQSIRQRPTLGLVQAQADALPFRAGTFDTVALLAIVEHVDHDERVLSEAYRVARPGGIHILLTSAFMLLWSHHDVANNHRRRYYARQIDDLQRTAGWRVLHTSYVNAFLFPAVAAVRILQRRTKPKDASDYDMGPNLGPLNWVMAALLGLEAWLIARQVRLPFGVDVFSVGQRDQ